MLPKLILSFLIFSGYCQMVRAQVSFDLPASPTPAKIGYAEYFIDADPGPGRGIPVSVTPATEVLLTAIPVNISAYAYGVHRLYFRTRDTRGAWSMTGVKTFFIENANLVIPSTIPASAITQLEYFMDTDPGFGQGILVPVSSSTDVSQPILVDLTGLTPGVHRIYFRLKDARGVWSQTNVQTYFIAATSAMIPANPTAAPIIKMEYFIDTDPGFGLGQQMVVPSSSEITLPGIPIDLSSLADGVHHIYFRSQDANGSWSQTNTQTFNLLLADVTLPPNPAAGMITRFEYFFDTDPGFGKGKILAVSPTVDLSHYTFAADISALQRDTIHTLYIRTFDDWSQTQPMTFLIGSALPVKWVSFNGAWLDHPDNKVLLSWKTEGEESGETYEVLRSTDGIHFDFIGSVPGSGTSGSAHQYSFTDLMAQVTSFSRLYYRIRQTDKDGLTSYSVVISLNHPSASRVHVSPNPGKGHFLIGIDKGSSAPVQLLIYDNKGGLVLGKKITGIEGDIDLTGKSKGLYWLDFHFADGSVQTLRVEVQ